jgi:hypothetical protein
MRYAIVITLLFASSGCQEARSPDAQTVIEPSVEPSVERSDGAPSIQSQRLIEAAFRGDTEIVKELIKDGVNVNARYNGSPSAFRTENGGIPVAGANWTALHAAASALRSEVISLLIDAGADLDLDDGYGATALAMSVDVYDRINQKDECALLLIGAGASANTKTGVYIDGVGGHSPLHRAVCWNQKRAVVALIEAGADVNTTNDAGHTPLHDAYLCSADPLIVRALLDAGANPDAKDKNGRTPLYWNGIYKDVR